MDVRRFLDAGVTVGLGTDVAGGASASMLDCIRNTISASRAMGFRCRSDYLHGRCMSLTSFHHLYVVRL